MEILCSNRAILDYGEIPIFFNNVPIISYQGMKIHRVEIMDIGITG